MRFLCQVSSYEISDVSQNDCFAALQIAVGGFLPALLTTMERRPYLIGCVLSFSVSAIRALAAFGGVSVEVYGYAQYCHVLAHHFPFKGATPLTKS